jgi:hypothetical protein
MLWPQAALLACAALKICMQSGPGDSAIPACLHASFPCCYVVVDGIAAALPKQQLQIHVHVQNHRATARCLCYNRHVPRSSDLVTKSYARLIADYLPFITSQGLFMPGITAGCVERRSAWQVASTCVPSSSHPGGARGRWRCCYGLTGNMMMMILMQIFLKQILVAVWARAELVTLLP